jgi:protein-L-isoaspartate(D-aspartate) O-methyltransferase
MARVCAPALTDHIGSPAKIQTETPLADGARKELKTAQTVDRSGNGMWTKRKTLEEARRDYARQQAEAAEWDDPRLEEAFAEVRREDFLPDPPWQLIEPGLALFRKTSEPADLYDDVLVVLDRDKGINNGEPILHAAWIGKVRPQPGEAVIHVGAGMGYYTAVLARLVSPGGRAIGYEVEPWLAEAAARKLEAVDNAEARSADAVSKTIPECDIIYVSAGVVAPPVQWLKALKPGGRLVFPWRPTARVGLALMATRRKNGFAVDVFSQAWFIPCIGASDEAETLRAPSRDEAAATRSFFPVAERAPDETATAIYRDVWFSSAALA